MHADRAAVASTTTPRVEYAVMGRSIEDARFTLRSLRRHPSFTLAATASLALGFALTAVAAAVLHAYSQRALPYDDAERLFHVRYAPPGPWEPRGVSTLDWAALEDVIASPIATRGETFYLSDLPGAQPARGLRVNRGFIRGLGVRVQVGRALSETDFAEGAEPAALIGHALWRTAYGSDPGVLGRTLRVEPESGSASERLRIVGVLEPGFYFGRDSTATVDLLVPSSAPMRAYMVRLQPGVPAAVAEARITDAVRAGAGALPADWDGAHLQSVYERYIADVRPILTGVTVAAGLVLVLVCANVAVLVVLRLLRRQKELAIRSALGGSRWDLTRMLLVESLVLCASAAALGLAVTAAVLPSIAPQIETQLGRPAAGGAGAIGVNTAVLVGVTAAAAAIVVLLSLLPLVTSARRLDVFLRRTGATGSDTPSTRLVRSSLIAFELAGAVVLLVSCGLMVRSVVSMLNTDVGFEPDRLVRGRIVLRAADYADGAAFFRFYEQFASRATAATHAPVVFSNWPLFAEFPAQVVETEKGEGPTAGAVKVGPGYFATLGITLRSGRDFTSSDIGGEPVAIVSEALAAQLWPSGQALGRLVRPLEPTPDGLRRGPWRRVVGVAANVRQVYGDPILRDIYLPLEPASAGRFGSYVARTETAPGRLWETLREIASDIDPRATVDEPRAVSSQNTELAGTTFLAGLLGAFAMVGAFIAVVGIYGVSAFAARQRERDLAIRMALGASDRAIVRLLLRDGSLVMATGLTAGLAGAAAAGALLESRLYGVSALDAPTLVATVLLLGLTALVAALLPARRAARQGPLAVLKEG